MLRTLLLLLAGLWVLPRLLRLLGGGRRRPDQAPPPAGAREREDRLQNLTQQDISDAEFEEIPPEE
jgi:hypothetical protein